MWPADVAVVRGAGEAYITRHTFNPRGLAVPG